MRKYSKIYKYEKQQFRYNYELSQIELITFIDFDFDENDKLIEIKLEVPQVITVSGLDKDDWKGSPLYYIELFNNQNNEELHYLSKGLEEEFGLF